MIRTCNGVGLKNLLQAGHDWLEAHLVVVNNLNVFPVPDGDTGTNMVLTMAAALNRVAVGADDRVGSIAAAAAQGALLGARGNSGVILSQFLKGLAQGLEGQHRFNAARLAAAMQAGVEQAYAGVIEPVEGTILTVMRAVAGQARQQAGTEVDLVNLLSGMVEAARQAQATTPELLPILKQAGVTDSGGQGFVYLLEGALRRATGQPVTGPAVHHPVVARPEPAGSEDRYGYDVQFLIHGEQLEVAAIRAALNHSGRSTLVVGDERLVKVHVHTHDPGQPLSYGAKLGRLSDVVVENMASQVRQFARARASIAAPAEEPGTVAIVAVVSGPELGQIFQSLGAGRVVPGGPTMNPSVAELLAAVRQVTPDDVLILPNHRQVMLVARQVQALVEKRVAVVPATTIPQGIAALLSFQPEADWSLNVQRMHDSLRQVRSVEITPANQDRVYDGLAVRAGELMGLLDENLVSTGRSEAEVLLDILSQTGLDHYELMTVYTGAKTTPKQGQILAEQVQQHYPELEVEVYEGGQPHALYIISLE